MFSSLLKNSNPFSIEKQNFVISAVLNKKKIENLFKMEQICINVS